MISRPLFISVAQSTVIFAPIFQFGWRSASRFGHTGQAFPRLPEKRPAGAGQNQAFDLGSVPAAHEALENGRVLGIDGNNFSAGFPRGSLHDLPCADHRLFIGKGDALFFANGRQRGPQRGKAAQRPQRPYRPPAEPPLRTAPPRPQAPLYSYPPDGLLIPPQRLRPSERPVRGRYWRHCASIRSTLRSAVSAATRSPSSSATDSVCRPMEPVEPKIVIVFVIPASPAKTASRTRRARGTASNRTGQARRRAVRKMWL